jgi:integrase
MAQITKRTTAEGENRYDVRTRIDGRLVTRTFKRRRDADSYAAKVEADRLRGVAIDPRRGQVLLGDYGAEWLDRRTGLAERTVELYRWLFASYIVPDLGSVPMAKLSPSGVAAWHGSKTAQHPTSAAKAYRLLSQIMKAAVVDEVIARNPCQVAGAATERAPERPVATLAELAALTEAMPDRLRVFVLLACWCQLRRGELLGLRRTDVDLLHSKLTIRSTRTTTMTGRVIEKAPKTSAGRRDVVMPDNVVEALAAHLDAYVPLDRSSYVFTGEQGGPLAVAVLRDAWGGARSSIGRPDLRIHDLRHTGLTFASALGATVAELMHRGGHASPRAALRYQHATENRDRVLADALAALARTAPVVPIAGRENAEHAR